MKLLDGNLVPKRFGVLNNFIGLNTLESMTWFDMCVDPIYHTRYLYLKIQY
jgi:hypothetical protein